MVKRIPIKVRLLLFICFLIPILFEFFAADTFLLEVVSAIAWLLYMIPSVFFSYYYGLKGGIFSIILFLAAHLTMEFIDPKGISKDELFIIAELAFANILLIVPISLLMEKLKAEKAHLQSVTQELTKSKEQLQNIFNHLDVAIWSLDVQEQSIHVSTALEKIYGITREEILENPISLWKEMIHPEDRWVSENLDQQLSSGQPSKAIYRIIRRDGEERWVEDRGVPLADSSGRVRRIDGVVIDITESKMAHDKIKAMAFQDPLTGLPNRRYFEKELFRAITQAKDSEMEQMAVLFMDLDGFKKVNDTLGHDAGDLLLQEVAVRCKTCIGNKESGVLSRFAGDEFTIFIPHANEAEAIRISQKFIQEIQKPFGMANSQVIVTPSIGISLYPEHGNSAKTLLKKADEAMYRAKQFGRNNFQVYSTEE
ncbi:sensor domain-containing diguanylate cyclase [Ammoniphilus resinae]|uniref:Diguanylate cyclase (GGDEF)-like protein/PAS domain S-box-containing protein n=1 Tax=Ammoniphilus resinae TaxID=861532 RepID=A0ABS4GXW1_9BACL|nr:sensor domain-containing diguanylate cyclase [Ammoniphilus resinae]MBP1934705.1 diguanylate cyclase (GGDEF)-like protein/PAS domain S-box-containing protein [Ammoniphilus resinae]